MERYPVAQNLKALSDRFSSSGHSLYLVGGAVRDFLLGKANDDFDFTTDATPEEVVALFPGKTIPTGIKHGTVTVRFRGQSYEITTFRTDGDYSDGRHPDSVQFVRSLESDLERRDFTINALACSLENGEILDFHEGIKDLENRTIRAIGRAEKRFEEDALRMMRACRFASKLDFDVEEETFRAIQENAENIVHVSQERIREELFKILQSDHPAKGLYLLHRSGVMKYILPELEEGVGMRQKGMHRYDVFDHILHAVQASADMGSPFIVRLAALMHDIGKPRSMRIRDGEPTFYSHEIVGEKMARKILSRLRCSNDEMELTALLVKEHMFNYTDEWTDSAVRRFLLKVGKENLPLLFALRRADQMAIEGRVDEENLSKLKYRLDKEIERGSALTVKDLKINGKDLIALGERPGPEMGRRLSALLEMVIENPELNEKESLIGLYRNM